LAIVPDSQFSLAIGRQGHNVRLANRLCDWTIDVKTESQAAELDLSEFVTNVPLFNEIPAEDAIDGQEQAVSAERETEEPSEISVVSDIPEIDGSVAEILKSSKYDDIQNFVDAYYDGSLLESGLLTKEQVESAFEIITKYVEIVDDDSEQPEE
ncbi:MAG: transcription termination/antitermination protein NusA, partial [Treponema sp.]|nr:transcription termination/antitermination protein NusA [Treponema sp.]